VVQFSGSIIGGDFVVQILEANLLPGRGRVVMTANELVRERVEFRLAFTGESVVATVEATDVEEGDDEEVEGI
jgi:hypothetical protein